MLPSLSLVFDEAVFYSHNGVVVLADLGRYFVAYQLFYLPFRERIFVRHDEVENEVVARPDGGYELDGAMTLSDFLELLDWNEDALDDADSTTVGGWTLERFGTFPKPGDSFRYENLTVTVLAMDGRRVERVLVQPDPPEDRDE